MRFYECDACGAREETTYTGGTPDGWFVRAVYAPGELQPVFMRMADFCPKHDGREMSTRCEQIAKAAAKKKGAKKR